MRDEDVITVAIFVVAGEGYRSGESCADCVTGADAYVYAAVVR